MRYKGPVYRPTSESESLVIQATIGCPHNECIFCGMYHDREFSVREAKEIIEDLNMARDVYGTNVRSLFLADGNSIVMDTRDIISVCTTAKVLFPELKNISLYGSPKYLVEKTSEDLQAISQAGITRVYSGLESGDENTFNTLNKGVSLEKAIEGYLKTRDTGIELHLFVIIGITGLDIPNDIQSLEAPFHSEKYSQQHAAGSSAVINQVSPHSVHLQTYVPLSASPGYKNLQRNGIKLLSPYEALREMYWLIEGIQVPVKIVADHISNYKRFTGDLPDARKVTLDVIEGGLGCPATDFRRRIEIPIMEDTDEEDDEDYDDDDKEAKD